MQATWAQKSTDCEKRWERAAELLEAKMASLRAVEGMTAAAAALDSLEEQFRNGDGNSE